MTIMTNIMKQTIEQIESAVAAVYRKGESWPEQNEAVCSAIAKILPDISMADAWALRNAIRLEGDLRGDPDDEAATILLFAAWALSEFVATGVSGDKRDAVARLLYLEDFLRDDEFVPGDIEKIAVSLALSDMQYGSDKRQGDTFSEWASRI